MSRPPLLLELICWPFGKLFFLIVGIRTWLFDAGILKVRAIAVPVVSIGNLTAGGTGKTPVVAQLTRTLMERGLSVAVISRGYGGSESGPIRVESSGSASAAARFGDEPSWLASELGCPVYIARKRIRAAQLAISEQVLDVIIADDAFQHRWLPRKYDVVVFDATVPEWHYRPLPLGRLREPWRALLRAQMVLINKTNLSDPAKVAWLKDKVTAVNAKLAPLIFQATVQTPFLIRLDQAQTKAQFPIAEALKSESYILLSAIARPESFAELVERSSGRKSLGHLIYPDHHHFSIDDRKQIVAEAERLGASAIVMTEKDASKLSGWNPLLRCWVTCYQLKVDERMYEVIQRKLL